MKIGIALHIYIHDSMSTNGDIYRSSKKEPPINHSNHRCAHPYLPLPLDAASTPNPPV